MFQIDEELYIPETNMSSLELRNNCSYFFEINADGRTINTKNYISGTFYIINNYFSHIKLY